MINEELNYAIVYIFFISVSLSETCYSFPYEAAL